MFTSFTILIRFYWLSAPEQKQIPHHRGTITQVINYSVAACKIFNIIDFINSQRFALKFKKVGYL